MRFIAGNRFEIPEEPKKVGSNWSYVVEIAIVRLQSFGRVFRIRKFAPTLYESRQHNETEVIPFVGGIDDLFEFCAFMLQILEPIRDGAKGTVA